MTNTLQEIEKEIAEHKKKELKLTTEEIIEMTKDLKKWNFGWNIVYTQLEAKKQGYLLGLSEGQSQETKDSLTPKLTSKSPDNNQDQDIINYFKGKDIKEADRLLIETAKNNFNKGEQIGRNKAIEEFSEKLKKEYGRGRDDGWVSAIIYTKGAYTQWKDMMSPAMKKYYLKKLKEHKRYCIEHKIEYEI
jgi:hypothetical protein